MSSRASIINALQSIIDNANATTGRSDTDVTTAANRLISGYGGGGTNIVADENVTGDGTNDLVFTCSEEPDAVLIYPTNWEWSDTTESMLTYSAFKGKFVLGMRRTGSAKNAAYTASIDDTDYPWGTTTGNYQVSGAYSNGSFTAYCRGTATQCKWSSTYTYRCIGIKL